MERSSSRSRYPQKNGKRRSNAGTERALQHIREAEELTEELKGADTDLKRIFFNLDNQSLAGVLTDYRALYGTPAYDYACKAIPRWRTGRVTMSGLVASRLFKFLPRHITAAEKRPIIEKLWRGYCPKSVFNVVVGRDATTDEVVKIVTSRLNDTVRQYDIPEKLKSRFLWLTEHNSRAAEELLNQCLLADRDLAIRDTLEKVPVILPHLQAKAGSSVTVRRQIEIGHHYLEVIFSSSETGIRACNSAEAAKYQIANRPATYERRIPIQEREIEQTKEKKHSTLFDFSDRDFCRMLTIFVIVVWIIGELIRN